MPRKRKPSELFVPLVPEARLHPGFNHLRTSKAEEPARLMMSEVYKDFPDPDGDFAEQFQTEGFNARTFELYLHAYLASSGYGIRRQSPGPDFIATHSGVSCAIEATTTNPSGGSALRLADVLDGDMSGEALEKKSTASFPSDLEAQSNLSSTSDTMVSRTGSLTSGRVCPS